MSGLDTKIGALDSLRSFDEFGSACSRLRRARLVIIARSRTTAATADA
jgi:hypothetical protein